MNGLTGMEKFSHLEDKIYLTIEFAKRMREEHEQIEKELSALRRSVMILRKKNPVWRPRSNRSFPNATPSN